MVGDVDCDRDRPGVAELMNEAGLTHGGFYKHFASRDDLMNQAAALALVDGEPKMAEAARRNREEPRTGLIDSYLSARHRDAPGTGCAVVTLGAAAGRGEAEMKEAYEKQVRSFWNSSARRRTATTPMKCRPTPCSR
ncbi:TetR/AcrR family transcriptional regulator [Actinacidiphila oryziradicis]|uniref:TetR/AcrR family transcriptional regulator n=1 Tax=Actinacidiphila oryziradicis TaxID=2571141 RepID=UPI001FE6FBF8|nr:TetR/AcrR family transcriptional regulator [Actinacidiphila oryziradicis]